MKITAQIICRKESYGTVCKWKGGRKDVAQVFGDVLVHRLGTPHIKAGDVFSLGRLRLRIVRWPLYANAGGYIDAAAVMLESPHAQLYQLYREKVEGLVRFTARCEMAVRAFNGSLREGEILPFTARLADKLL